MTEKAKAGGIKSINDPVKWQVEQRKEDYSMEGKNDSEVVDSNILITAAGEEHTDLALSLNDKSICISDITRFY